MTKDSTDIFSTRTTESGSIFASERGGISDEEPIVTASQLYGELYAYRIHDGTMIRSTDNKCGKRECHPGRRHSERSSCQARPYVPSDDSASGRTSCTGT